MIEKLAILYALMSNFSVKLSQPHSLVLIKIVDEQPVLGKALIQLSNKIKKVSNEWETIFLIYTREKGNMAVFLVVDKEECLIPFVPVLEGLQKLLEQYNIELVLETFANFSRVEKVEF